MIFWSSLKYHLLCFSVLYKFNTKGKMLKLKFSADEAIGIHLARRDIQSVKTGDPARCQGNTEPTLLKKPWSARSRSEIREGLINAGISSLSLWPLEFYLGNEKFAKQIKNVNKIRQGMLKLLRRTKCLPCIHLHAELIG